LELINGKVRLRAVVEGAVISARQTLGSFKQLAAMPKVWHAVGLGAAEDKAVDAKRAAANDFAFHLPEFFR